MHSLPAWRLFKKHLFFLTNELRIEGLCFLIAQGEQPFGAAFLFFFIHHIRDIERLCARAFAVGKHMELGHG